MRAENLSDANKNRSAVTLFLKGDIDKSSAPKVRELLVPYYRKNQRAIIVDLSGVTHIDSTGIAILVEGLQWSHCSKNKFRLACLTPTVKDVFETVHLLRIFDVFETKEDALAGVERNS